MVFSFCKRKVRIITLVENKTIKAKSKTKELFKRLDDYSFKAKNLKTLQTMLSNNALV